MIKNVLEHIGGVGAYGVASISIFFVVFTLALIRAFALKKKFLNTMSALPLEDSDDNDRTRHE